MPTFQRLIFVSCVALLGSFGCSADAQDKTRYWNLSWSWEDVDIGKLTNRLSSVGLEIPIDATGDASVDVQVGIPLNALRSSDKYRLQGTITSAKLQVDQMELRDFQAVIDVQDGIASLQELHAQLGTKATGENVVAADDVGTIDGSAKLQFAPPGNVSANLNVKSVEIQPLHQIYLSTIDQSAFTGSVSGEIQFQAPYESLADVTQWSVDADVRIDQFRSGVFPAANLATGPIKIDQGDLKAKQVQISIAGDRPSHLMAAAHIELAGKRRFDIGISGDDIPVTEIAAAFASGQQPWVLGTVDLDLTASGKLGDDEDQWSELAEMQWRVDGQIASPKLTAAGIDLGLLEHRIHFDQNSFRFAPLAETANENVVLKRIAAKYQIAADVIELNELNAQVFDGQISGKAILRLNEAQEHQLDLAWDALGFRIDKESSPLPLALATLTSGKIDWSVAANAPLDLAKHRGRIDVRLEKIELGDAEVGQLSLVADSTPGAIDLQVAGSLFGGDLSIETQTEKSPDMTLSHLLGAKTQGEITVSALNAERVLAMVPPHMKPKLLRRRWQGNLSAKAIVKANVDANARVDVRAAGENLTLDGHVLARRVNLHANWVDNRLVVDQLSGLAAGGRFDATGRMRLNLANGQVSTGQVTTRLSSMDTSELLFLVSPDLAKQVDGRVSARLVVSGGQRDRIGIRGSMTLSDAETFGLAIDSAHSDISGWVTTRVDRWRFDLPTIAGETGRGQLSGNLLLKSANRPSKVDLRSNWKLRRVDFAKTLGGAEAASGALGEGRLSGSLALNADSVAGVQDLYGNFDFELDGSRGRSIPGLTEAQNFLGPVGLAGVQFDDGRAKGVIGGGRATLQEFWLRSPQLMVWAEGAITLASLRLDLEAVISTGDFESNSSLISTIGLLAIDYATPVGILLEINQLLSNRTVFVDVVGPATDPSLRLKPLETIRENAAQFLLQQFLPVPCQLPGQQNPLAR